MGKTCCENSRKMVNRKMAFQWSLKSTPPKATYCTSVFSNLILLVDAKQPRDRSDRPQLFQAFVGATKETCHINPGLSFPNHNPTEKNTLENKDALHTFYTQHWNAGPLCQQMNAEGLQEPNHVYQTPDMPNGKICLGDAIRHQLNKLSWGTSSNAWTPHHSLCHREILLLFTSSSLRLRHQRDMLSAKLNFLWQKYRASRGAEVSGESLYETCPSSSVPCLGPWQ